MRRWHFLPALRWSPHLHCSGVITSITLLLLPALHQGCCPCCTDVFALIAPTLSPALQTGICPVMTQLPYIGVHVVVAVLFIVICGFVAVTGVLPQQLGLQWSGQCSAGIFVGIALASLPALCWHHCQHHAVIVAGVMPASSPLSCGHNCPCCASLVAIIASMSPPALQTGVCPVTPQL
jgi:hypothetical protein